MHGHMNKQNAKTVYFFIFPHAPFNGIFRSFKDYIPTKFCGETSSLNKQ